MTPRLSRGAVVELNRRVDDLFDRLLTRLLGGSFSGKHLYITHDPVLSMPSLFAQAAASEGGTVDHDMLQSLADVTKHFVDSQRESAKAITARRVNMLLEDVKAGRIEPEHFRNHVESELIDTWGRITSNVERITNTESQHVLTMGLREGINQMSAVRGITDPVVVFIPKQDGALCNECRRTHLIETTPRCWYHSEVSSDYHKRGEDKPSWHLMHPHCFVAGTRIFTDRGVVGIETLVRDGGSVGVVVDNRVRVRSRMARRSTPTNGLWLDRHASGATVKPASEAYDTGVQDCYRITLDSGHQVTVSAGHEMWVDDDRVGSKVRADALRVGDKVPLLSGEGAFGSKSFPVLAELMGNCLGDGGIASAQASWRFFGEDILYGQGLWTRARGLMMADSPSMVLRESLRVLPPGRKYAVSSAGFASSVLKRMMAAEGLVDKKPRMVPAGVWLADKQTQTAFLRGLFAADGHAEAAPSVVLAQNDLGFLREVQALLANLGLVSRIFKHGSGGEKILTWNDGTEQTTTRKPCWRLAIGGWSQVRRFADDVGLGVPSKQAKLTAFLSLGGGHKKLGAWRTARVESVEFVGQQQTYCLTEPETNTVTANGIVTGNCRCSLATVIPGYGFDAAGRVTFIKDGWNELKYQRSAGNLGGVDDRRNWKE